MNSRYGPVQMSTKPDPLSVSVERDHHHHHHLNHPISHNSIQSLSVPALTGGRYSAPLPALQDPRYTSAPTSSTYDAPSLTPTSSPIAYSTYSNGYTPTSYPQSATSNSYNYSLTSEARPRIPAIQSPTSVMSPHHRSSSGSKSASPSQGSSVRAAYSTSTPGLARHQRPTATADIVNSPHSPMTPATVLSPTMPSLASPSHDHTNGLNSAGPPLSETQHLHHLSSADGHTVRPEIHARVDKGFFLSDRDWTCYRRNYFSVICSYSLLPATYSLPLYLRRSNSSPPEHILSFAMCISAVVDAPGGKTVELVQHTPKRDKGPQHKPAKIKLSPQPAGGMYSGANSSSMQQSQQQGHSQQSGLEHDYSFPQQAPQQQQQQQHIAVFDRIQFKSATANNGKRRAAQQYYHLIVELYADVGNAASSAPGQPNVPGSDAGWVKIAHRISAPMVVRGRSPGHYADERRASSTSSPGGGATGGNHGGPHPPPHTSGGSGYMGPEGLSSAAGGGSAQGMNTLQHVSTPPTSSVNHHSTPSIASGSPASHYTPIDPNLGVSDAATPPIPATYENYSYIPTPLYESAHMPPPSVDSGYDETTHSYNGDRKSEHALDTACSQYEQEIAAYIPTTVASPESYRKPIKEEFGMPSNMPWLGASPLPRDTRIGQGPNLFVKCGRFESADTSKNYYPDIPSL